VGLLGRIWLGTGARALRDAAASLEASQELPPAALAAHQENLLAALVHHAHRGSPSWRARIDAAGGPGVAGTLAGLAVLPLMGRADLLRPDAVVGPREALVSRTTGGTTGAPVEILVDPASNLFQLADHLRCGRWIGLEPGDRHVLVWGVPTARSGYTSARGRVRALARGRLVVPMGSLERRSPAAWRRLLAAWRPRYLAGFPTGLDRLARHLDAAGLALPVAASVAWAEQVFEHQREAVRRAFRVDLHDRYGCNEFTTVAHTCRCHGLHLLADRLVVEVLRGGRPAAPGEPGELVVTDLRSFGMPLIRYRTGDLARAGSGPCRCGLGLPLLGSLEGRVQDAMRDREGGLILPRDWLRLAAGDPAGPGFAVHREAGGAVRVMLLPRADVSGVRDRLAGFVAARLGEPMRFERVEVLPLTPMGKTRWVRAEGPPVAGAGLEDG